MTASTIIYGLIDPRDGMLRYVGKSRTGMERPKKCTKPSLMSTEPGTHKTRWLESLLADGLRPDIVVLEECEPEALNDAECYWISITTYIGCNLVNGTAGGDGGPTFTGRRHTPETRAKMSAALIGNKRNVGRKHSQEARANMSAAQRGNTNVRGCRLSEEHKRLIAAGVKTYWARVKGVQ